ncbi:hypothetical protein Tco_0764331 [Tanacetum coccineum]
MKGALDNSHNIPKRNSHWLDIIREVKRLSYKGIDLSSFMKKKVSNGECTSFWEDYWLLDESLKQTYPRLFLLKLNKNITVAAKMRDSTLISSFRRAPRGGNEEAQEVKIECILEFCKQWNRIDISYEDRKGFELDDFVTVGDGRVKIMNLWVIGKDCHAMWSCPNIAPDLVGALIVSVFSATDWGVTYRLVSRAKADGSQSPRVPVPFPEDPYEAIRQACLVETDIESEPFEDQVETETLVSSHTVASPTSLPDSTPPTHHTKESEDSDTSGGRSTSSDFTAPLSPDHPLTHTSPTLVPFLCRTARMALRVSPAMSPGLSTSITEVATMSDSAFRKRFRYSYETSPTSSPPDLPLRKRSRGTSELVEDNEEWDDEEEDEEVEESSGFDSESENAEDEGPAEGDVGLVARDEVLDMRVKSLGLGGDEAVPEGQQRAAPIVKASMDPKDGRAYIDVPAYPPPAPPVQTPPSPEWSSGSLPVSTAPSIVPSPILSPMIPLTVPSPVASPATVKAEGFLTELGAQVEMQEGLIHDHMVQLGDLSPSLFERYDRDIGELFTRSGAVRDEIFSQRYRPRSLEHEQERVAVTFGAIWRPILALESWAGHMDTQRAAPCHAIGDTQMENRELRL